MHDDYGPSPIDSDDMFAMGLRQARCNGCELAKRKHELGDECLVLHHESGWTTVYKLGEEPLLGQAEPLSHEGKPIRFVISFRSVGHSDECYDWSPP